MDYQLILNKRKESIINDIRGDVYEHFKSRQFITEDEFDSLNDHKLSIEVRNEKFFEILLRIVDQNVFDEFLSALKENYWWIAKGLHEEVGLSGLQPVIQDILPADPYHLAQKLEEESEKVLKRGGTPLHQLSSLYVSRWEMEEKLMSEIRGIKPSKFLVLLGMPGSGRSSLAMKVLKNFDLLINCLQGNVFWLSELKTIEQILLKLRSLMDDGDDLDNFHGEISPIILQSQIANLIQKNKLEEALIVFDDVVSNDFIKYLNFNCKKLIISHDEKIVDEVPSKEVKIFKIDIFLTIKQGQILLAQASGVNVANLPTEAKEIIQLTKAFPFLLHFLAKMIQQNKEALNNGLWKYIRDVLRRERRGEEAGPMDPLFSIVSKKLYNVFDNQLENLEKEGTEKQRYYEIFAVFESDINLNIEVFATIWSMNKVAVINLLDEFENKSLIGKIPNPLIGGYVYGIHDVLLNYLRNRKKDNLKELHNMLIDKYYEKCDGEFWKLPSDNYIYFFLGYHLKKAERLELFNQFLDLQFAVAKIKAVGASDLLNDYKKYEPYIATAGNEKLLKEMKEFVEHYGHIIYQSDDIDIIQLGLQQKESSAIFKNAKALALKQTDKLFLNFQPKHEFVDSNSDSMSSRIPKEVTVTVACFSDDVDFVFLANSDGRITKKKLGESYSAAICVPSGDPKKGIDRLILSPNKQYLLSVCQDLEFRIWDLLEVSSVKRSNFNGHPKSGDKSPSPTLRQEAHSPIFPGLHQNLKADMIAAGAQHHTLPLTCIKFSPDSEYILSCSSDRSLTMWNIEKNVSLSRESIAKNPYTHCGYALHVSWRKYLQSVARCCTFTLDGKTVLVGCDNMMLFSWTVDYGFGDKKFVFDSAIKCLHTVNGVNGAHPAIEDHSDFVLVLSNRVEVIRIQNSYLRSTAAAGNNNKNFELLCSWSFQKSQENFITRSWVPENGSFIALTTSMNCVSLYNLANGHLQREYVYEIGQDVKGIDFFMKEETSYMLVLCPNEVLRRKLELSPNEQASKFCVAPKWGGNQEPTVVVPHISGCKVVIGEDSRWLDLKTKVTSCHIDRNASLVVIGTDCGTVYLYNLLTEETNTILEFKDCHKIPSLVVLVRIFVIENENLIVAVDSKHLIKVYFKNCPFQYQAKSEVKGLWYCYDTNELIVVLNQQIKVCKVTGCLQTDGIYDLIQADGNGNNALEGSSANVRWCCDFSSTNYLAVATSKTAQMINVNDRHVSQLSFNQSVNCCGFSADGLRIAFGFADGAIQVYNTVPGKLLRELSVRSPVQCVCLGNGARLLAALTSQRIHVSRWTGAGYRSGCTNLQASQLIKAPQHDCFLTVDKHSRIFQVTCYNFQSTTQQLDGLTINSSRPPSSRPKLIIKRKLQH